METLRECRHCGKAIHERTDEVGCGWQHLDGYYACLDGNGNLAEPSDIKVDQLQIINGLERAIRTVKDIRVKQADFQAVWEKLNRIDVYLNMRLAEEIRIIDQEESDDY